MKTVSELFFTLGFDRHLSGFLVLFTCVANLFMNKFCPLYDQQVITLFLVKLRFNFTCVFKVAQMKLNLNFTWPHAITYTNLPKCT